MDKDVVDLHTGRPVRMDEVDPAQVRFLDVQRLELKPGDYVVLSSDEHLNEAAVTRIRASLMTLLGGEYPVIVLSKGFRIGVLGRG